MIIITGATGQLGRAVVEKLLETTPANQIGVSVRDPEKAHDLQDQGVRVRHGDFNDAASLVHAFEGATRVFIVSSGSTGEPAMRQHHTAIEAAKAAGTQRIFYTSHMGASATSAFSPMTVHAATEAMLKECGVPYTSLRNGFYANSALLFLGKAAETGELRAPEDGKIAYTTHADLAEAAALYLAGDESEAINGPTPNLTASKAYDLADVAALASEITARPIRRVMVSEAEQRESMTAHGVPGERLNLLLGIYTASKQGDFADVSPALAELLGHPPIPLRDVFEKALSAKE